MRAAAVLHVDDVPVGRQFIAAHTEHRAERTGQRQEEPAIPADPLGGLRHLRARPVIAVMPALRGPGATPAAHHLTTSEPDLGSGLVDLRVTGRHIAGHQPRVVRQRREQVAGAQVTGLDALIPRQPFRRQQRLGPGYQHHLADRRMVGAGVAGHHDRPLPALVTGQVGEETVGGAGRVFISDAEVVADGVVTAAFDDGSTRQVGRASENGRQFRRPLRRGRIGHIVRCFHGPVDSAAQMRRMATPVAYELPHPLWVRIDAWRDDAAITRIRGALRAVPLDSPSIPAWPTTRPTSRITAGHSDLGSTVRLLRIALRAPHCRRTRRCRAPIGIWPR